MTSFHATVPAASEHGKAVVACLGAGLIGASWAGLFSATGYKVRLQDNNTHALEAARGQIEKAQRELQSIGVRVAETPTPVITTSSLEAAVTGADHVQESITECLQAKRMLFAQVREYAPGAILASSTSTFPPSAIFSEIANRENTIVAHPLLPPHMIPIVELVPATFTSDETMEQTERLLRSVGHEVIRLNREIPGFVLNRLQFALMGEAFHLVTQGYCSPADIDKAVSIGLGFRWTSIGLFAGMHLNADGGVRGSLSSYRSAVEPVMRDLKSSEPWSDDLPDIIDAPIRAITPEEEIPAARDARDARLLALRRTLATFKQ